MGDSLILLRPPLINVSATLILLYSILFGNHLHKSQTAWVLLHSEGPIMAPKYVNPPSDSILVITPSTCALGTITLYLLSLLGININSFGT